MTDHQQQSLPNDHLHQDLRDRLADGSISFVLQIIVGEQGDDPTDPTTAWSVQRTRITGGVLKFDDVVADQHEDQERVSYNPTRTLVGFVPFQDDLLIQARREALPVIVPAAPRQRLPRSVTAKHRAVATPWR